MGYLENFAESDATTLESDDEINNDEINELSYYKSD